jgi:hypothetical protein
MKRNTVVHLLHITSIFCAFSNLNLYSHGFSKTTKVHGNVSTHASFKKLCYNVHEGTTQYVSTYDIRTRRVDAVKRVVKSAESEHHVRVYVRLSCQQGYSPPVMIIGATIGFFVAMVTVAVHQHQLPKFSVDAYTPVSHTVLYESIPQPGYQSQFDTTPTPRVEPVGCFHPVPYEQPIGCGGPAPIEADAAQGCGNGEPIKPIIHITLPIPQSEKENIGCRTLPEEKKNHGCHGMPILEPQKSSVPIFPAAEEQKLSIYKFSADTQKLEVCMAEKDDKSTTVSQEHPNGIYENAPYHHKNSKGLKSACPKNGQKALDESVPIKDTAPHRVGISENEIVVLKQTSPGKFHGYTTTWKELEQGGTATHKIRDALTENKLVNLSGKILK